MAAASVAGLSCATEAEDVEGVGCEEELSLAEEVLRGLRMSDGFLTQFWEIDSGTGPNKSGEKKLEPKRASLVLSEPAPPPMGPQNFFSKKQLVPNDR